MKEDTDVSFVYVQDKNKLLSIDNWEDIYNNSIIFIDSTNEIWTHGQYFSIPHEIINNKINKEEIDIDKVTYHDEVVDEDTFDDFDKITKDELKEALFIDMFNEGCNGQGKYDYENAPDKTKPYYLNKIWLSYKEALTVHRESTGSLYYQRTWNFSFLQARTLYPIYSNNGSQPSSSAYEFYNSKNLETLYFVLGYNQISSQTFQNCGKLRRLMGSYLYMMASAGNAFTYCPLLEYMSISRLSISLNLSKNPKLEYSAFKQMVNSSQNGSTITITVHPDVYAALCGEAPEYPFNLGTQEEWEQLLTTAADRKIVFATV